VLAQAVIANAQANVQANVPLTQEGNSTAAQV